MNNPCPNCCAPRPPRTYLCRNCWSLLPTATRQALNRADNHARLRELHKQIDAGVPLADIQVTP
jgi:uncharacterized protein YlaI